MFCMHRKCHPSGLVAGRPLKTRGSYKVNTVNFMADPNPITHQFSNAPGHKSQVKCFQPSCQKFFSCRSHMIRHARTVHYYKPIQSHWQEETHHEHDVYMRHLKYQQTKNKCNQKGWNNTPFTQPEDARSILSRATPSCNPVPSLMHMDVSN